MNIDPVLYHDRVVEHLKGNLDALGFSAKDHLNTHLPDALKHHNRSKCSNINAKQDLPHRYSHITNSPSAEVAIVFAPRDSHSPLRNSALVEVILHFLLTRFDWNTVARFVVRNRYGDDVSRQHPDDVAHLQRSVVERCGVASRGLNVSFPCLERDSITAFKTHVKELVHVLCDARRFTGLPAPSSSSVAVDSVLAEGRQRCAMFLLQLSAAAMHVCFDGRHVDLCRATPTCVLEAIRAKQVDILKQRAALYVSTMKNLSNAETNVLGRKEELMRRLARAGRGDAPLSVSGQNDDLTPGDIEMFREHRRWVSSIDELHELTAKLSDSLRHQQRRDDESDNTRRELDVSNIIRNDNNSTTAQSSSCRGVSLCDVMQDATQRITSKSSANNTGAFGQKEPSVRFKTSVDVNAVLARLRKTAESM